MPSDITTNDWSKFQSLTFADADLGLAVDASAMGMNRSNFDQLAPAFARAFDAMDALERGEIANPDEQRMVGHYWLRNPDLAPAPELKNDIESSIQAVKQFAADIHAGTHGSFKHLLSLGIGGSALGPMFVADALGEHTTDKLTPHFVDNTDPDGIGRILSDIGDELDQTLVLVTSKSGGTPETRNAMLVVADAFKRASLDFAKHAVAITGEDSKLDKLAKEQSWLARFGMWDWVGGRTSELAAVGLLPAALQGLDIDAMLDGARRTDILTRNKNLLSNPAAILAACWHHATNAKGEKDMVVLPYRDRLLLLSRYLQQLIMESLGKQLDLDGNTVEQGISVYGNKGSTDQHAYVQQLRDGVNNFFAVFVRVLEPWNNPDSFEVEPGITSADYLHGFLLGTREALAANNRASLTITLQRADAAGIGAIIALFERAVGFYATLVNINAYHQPGVEAGKKAAAGVLDLQQQVISAVSDAPQTAGTIAAAASAADRTETVFLLLEHLAANGRISQQGFGPAATFSR